MNVKFKGYINKVNNLGNKNRKISLSNAWLLLWKLNISNICFNMYITNLIV